MYAKRSRAKLSPNESPKHNELKSISFRERGRCGYNSSGATPYKTKATTITTTRTGKTLYDAAAGGAAATNGRRTIIILKDMRHGSAENFSHDNEAGAGAGAGGKRGTGSGKIAHTLAAVAATLLLQGICVADCAQATCNRTCGLALGMRLPLGLRLGLGHSV